jgi:transcription elongation factor Elf1
MKFYEVQKALEEGKKIKLSQMKGTYFYIFDAGKKLLCVGPGHSEYILSLDELLADDWEILEDIPETKLSLKYVFLCPSCKTYRVLQQLKEAPLHSQDATCGNCGQNVKLKPFELISVIQKQLLDDQIMINELLTKQQDDYVKFLKEIIIDYNLLIMKHRDLGNYNSSNDYEMRKSAIEYSLDVFQKMCRNNVQTLNATS